MVATIWTAKNLLVWPLQTRTSMPIRSQGSYYLISHPRNAPLLEPSKRCTTI